MNELRRLPLLGLSLLVLAGCDAGSDEVGGAIAGPPSCDGCAIELVQGVLLASDEGAGSAQFPAAVARLSDGSYIVGPTYERGTVALFNRDGQFARVVGRYGEGPGEMEEVHEPVPWSGDSLAILHDVNSVSVFDRGGTWGRSMSLGPPSFLTRDISGPHTGTLIARRTGTAGGADAALRAYSVDGEPILTFGPESPLGAGRVYAGFATSDQTIWAADTWRYEIDVFSRTAEDVSGTVVRSVEWFPPDPPRNEWGGRPSVQDVAHYGPGEMLVLLRRPRSDYEFTPRASSDAPAAAGRQPEHAEMLERYEQVIELLDLEGRRVVAELRVEDEWVGGFLDGDEIFTYHTDQESGRVGLRVWALRLVGGAAR